MGAHFVYFVRFPSRFGDLCLLTSNSYTFPLMKFLWVAYSFLMRPE
jgi:hypothetical protein